MTNLEICRKNITFQSRTRLTNANRKFTSSKNDSSDRLDIISIYT